MDLSNAEVVDDDDRLSASASGNPSRARISKNAAYVKNAVYVRTELMTMIETRLLICLPICCDGSISEIVQDGN